MDKVKVINELARHYCLGNKTEFAKMLGISQSRISMWVSRSHYDAELISSKCKEISPDWLLSGGDGSMFRDEYKPLYDRDTKNRILAFCTINGIDEGVFNNETGLTLEGIAEKYPNLNPVWLLTGTGDMFIHNIDGNYNIGSGNQAIGGSTININDTQVIQLQKRIEELEKLVEQKDKMIDILTGRK